MSPRRCGLAPTLPLALALAAGCAAKIKVSQDYKAGTDYSAYQTFAFVPAERMEERFGKSRVAPATEQHIQAALSRELAARGLRPAGPAEPDLAVAFRAGAHKTVEDAKYGQTFEWAGEAGHPVDIEREVDEGWLTVYLVDLRTGELVWRGEGSTTKGDPQSIDRTVAAIVGQYPPQRR